jgi:hypothetical protein
MSKNLGLIHSTALPQKTRIPGNEYQSIQLNYAVMDNERFKQENSYF